MSSTEIGVHDGGCDHARGICCGRPIVTPTEAPRMTPAHVSDALDCARIGVLDAECETRLKDIASLISAIESGSLVVVEPETLAACVPTTWLDPMLTGPNAVIVRYPYTGDDIERLLAAIRDRITALSTPSPDTEEESDNG